MKPFNYLPDQLVSTLVHCLQLSRQAKDFIVMFMMLEGQERSLEQFELSYLMKYGLDSYKF